MNHKGQQESEEKFYLEKFLPLIGLDGARLSRGDEPPDFHVVTPDGKNVAIEITEFHSSATGADGVPRRSIEESWNKLQKAISQERKTFNELDDIVCLLRFSQFKVPPVREHKEFASQLLQFIKENLDVVSDNRQNFTNFSEDKDLLLKYLASVMLSRIQCYITWEWTHSGGMIGVNESELLKIISAKSNPVANQYDQSWLLIVCGYAISQQMGAPNVELLKGFKILEKALMASPYSNVFIYEYMFDHQVLEWNKISGWVTR